MRAWRNFADNMGRDNIRWISDVRFTEMHFYILFSKVQEFFNNLSSFNIFYHKSEAFSKNRSHLYDSEISSYIFETADKNLSFKFVGFFQYFKRWIKAIALFVIKCFALNAKSNSNPHFPHTPEFELIFHSTFEIMKETKQIWKLYSCYFFQKIKQCETLIIKHRLFWLLIQMVTSRYLRVSSTEK